MSDREVTLLCIHVIVEVETTDGERVTISVCQLSGEDINSEGKLEWPPTGRCGGPMLEDVYGRSEDE